MLFRQKSSSDIARVHHIKMCAYVEASPRTDKTMVVQALFCTGMNVLNQLNTLAKFLWADLTTCGTIFLAFHNQTMLPL